MRTQRLNCWTVIVCSLLCTLRPTSLTSKSRSLFYLYVYMSVYFVFVSSNIILSHPHKSFAMIRPSLVYLPETESYLSECKPYAYSLSRIVNPWQKRLMQRRGSDVPIYRAADLFYILFAFSFCECRTH